MVGGAARNPAIWRHVFTCLQRGPNRMPRRTHVPQPWLHKQTGQARVTLPDPSGKRQFVILGLYGTPEADAVYNRVLSEWLANGRRLANDVRDGSRTVVELIDAFWSQHVVQHYVKPDGTPTSEQGNFRCALRALRAASARTPVRAFGPLALRSIQAHLATTGLSRREVNRRIGLIRRCFKCGVAQELVPVEVYHRLATVEGLRNGRSAASERPPVRPVDDSRVEAVLPRPSRSGRTERSSSSGLTRKRRLANH